MTSIRSSSIQVHSATCATSKGMVIKTGESSLGRMNMYDRILSIGFWAERWPEKYS